MRIKVLACAAAVAAGALTSMAQSNVYSLNVVGYINLPLTAGFNLVANQLDADGTGTNNTVSGVFSSNLPLNSVVYTYSLASGSFNVSTYAIVRGQSAASWAGASNPLNPGQAAWVYIAPASITAGTTQMVTTVGQVLTGINLSNPNIPAAGGWGFVSSQIPLAGGLQTTLGYNPNGTGTGENFYLYTGSGYNVYTYSKARGQTAAQWQLPAGEPQIAVGQGFWGDYQANSTWTTNFTVGP